MKLLSILFILLFSSVAFGQNKPQANCSYIIDPFRSQQLGNDDGEVTVNVTVEDGCAWTAESAATWIFVLTGKNGVGKGTVRLFVSHNVQVTEKQTGWVEIGGRRLTIVQDPNCSYSLSGGSADFAQTGGDGSFSVQSPALCSWSAISDSDWITVQANSSEGAGNAPISFTIAANTGTARTGTIRVGGRTFTVSQAAFKSRKRVRFI